MKTKLQRRKLELLGELREAIPSLRSAPNEDVMTFCNITKETLEADCTNEAVPWTALSWHYYALGIRSARARSLGRFPDGTHWGSEFQRNTPPFNKILCDKQYNE